MWDTGVHEMRPVAKGILMSAGFGTLQTKDRREGAEIFREKADEICLSCWIWRCRALEG